MSHLVTSLHQGDRTLKQRSALTCKFLCRMIEFAHVIVYILADLKYLLSVHMNYLKIVQVTRRSHALYSITSEVLFLNMQEEDFSVVASSFWNSLLREICLIFILRCQTKMLFIPTYFLFGFKCKLKFDF